MKLAVSTIAWHPTRDDAVRPILTRHGVTGLELAPLAYWPTAPDVAPNVLADFRARWADAGISIVALQGVLFERPQLQLFGSMLQRSALKEHLRGMIRLAAAVGAQTVVFGAPTNRRRGVLSEHEAMASATAQLREIVRSAAELGVALCVEPIPSADFVQTTRDEVNLVQTMNHPGMGVHLDAAELSGSGVSDVDIIEIARTAQHFHISEVDLGPVGSGTVDHARLGRLLRRARYDRWVSVEMKRIEPDAGDEQLERAISFSREMYG